MPWGEIDALLQAVKATGEVVPMTLSSHEKAVRLCKRYSLSFYDAHICAAAVLAGAESLLSEDMQDGLNIDGASICNPFNNTI